MAVLKKKVIPIAEQLEQALTTASDADLARLRTDLLIYMHTDMLCYHSDQHDLAAKQREMWEPPLKAIELRLSIRCARTQGLMPLTQPNEVEAALRHAVSELNRRELIAAAALVPLCGSLILGLAFIHGEIGPDSMIEAAQLEESWQANQWGEDEEAAEIRNEKAQAMQQIAEWFKTDELCKSDKS